MLNLVYLFLIDENGLLMVGFCLVLGCEGVIEFKLFIYNVNILVDGNIGKLMGMCIYMFVMFQKEFDCVILFLFWVLSMGRMFQLVIIKMYQINEVGLEQEYFNIIMENVKIIFIIFDLYSGVNIGIYFEMVFICYEKIIWKYCDGNVIYSDVWNE